MERISNTATYESFGEWLQAHRLARGFSKLGLSKAAGISDPMVGYLESGARNASKKMAVALADALAGPDATEEAREKLRNEAKALAMDVPEMVREPDAEYILEKIVAYTGDDPTINGFKGFLLARAVAREVPPEEDWIEEVDGPREAPKP